MAIDPWAGANQGIDSLNNSMLTIAQLKRQDKDDAQRSSLLDLQKQQTQQGIEQNKLTLADLNAKRTALIDQYGTAAHTDPYASAVSFQQQEGADAQAMEKKQQGFQVYLNTIKALDGMTTLDPKTKTEIGKHFLAQNPEYAPFAENLKYIDSKGVKAARMFQEGELKDPVTGQPLPAGYYETEGRWTGDAANPVELLSYKAIEPKKDEHETWGEPEQMTVGGKTAIVQKSSRGQIRPVIQDTAPRITVNSGGGNGGGNRPMPQGKAPSGYRYTADGNLEAIPGGPAALKVQAAEESKVKAAAAYEGSAAVIDRLLKHPGRKAATGLSSKLDPSNYVPGTDAYDFQRELESFDAVLFLSNIEKMKGMGALSNAEGAKVSAAAGAIKPGMSEKAFENNLNIIRRELLKAKERIEGGMGTPPAAGSGGGKPPTGKPINATIAQRFLRQAGGNKDKARELAKKAGYSF